MASLRLMSFSFAHFSMLAISSCGSLALRSGSLPVAGRPLFFFGCTLIFDFFAMNKVYLKCEQGEAAHFHPGSDLSDSLIHSDGLAKFHLV